MPPPPSLALEADARLPAGLVAGAVRGGRLLQHDLAGLDVT